MQTPSPQNPTKNLAMNESGDRGGGRGSARAATIPNVTPAREAATLRAVNAEHIGVAILPGKDIIGRMLNVTDSKLIADLATKYALKGVFLFGSAARMDDGYRDIDLAIEGIRPQDFFRLYGELLSRLSRPVDLVDLDEPSSFTRFLREEGKLVRVA